MSSKSKKYQMYRNLNSQSKQKDTTELGPRHNYKNIHEKYMQRAKEIEAQEKKIKKELQSRVEDVELPHIYRKSKVGVQRVVYDPRYDNEYQQSSHKYGSESENKRTPALMVGPRIVTHSKEQLSSRGNLMNDSHSPVSIHGLSPYESKINPYANGYSSKSHKLAKLNGLPPSSKYNG